MNNCAVCHAPLAPGSDVCAYLAHRSEAPWQGDFAAMYRGDMTHLQHKTHVARWFLHHGAEQTEKTLLVFQTLAAAHAGQHIAIFELGGPEG